jgi:TatD DNase family protein
LRLRPVASLRKKKQHTVTPKPDQQNPYISRIKNSNAMPANDYINIHTHQPSAHLHEIINLYQNFNDTTLEKQYSMGIHPWHINNAEDQLNALKQYSTHSHITAIGECGLDKVCTTDWSLQQQVFQQQIEWANTLQKPLIIHCVRAYTEALSMLRDAVVPVIFHGFNKKWPLAEDILNHGHYLSFGAALLHDNNHAKDTLAQMPSDRFFLETDEAAINIEDVYKAAANIRKTDEDVIILQLQHNYKKVFGS